MSKQFLNLILIATLYILNTNTLSAQREMFSSVVPQIQAFESSVEITWKSNQGLKNDFFVIERSADNETFAAIQKINGEGEEGETINFDEMDENPLKGINFYRLRQVFKDGSMALTNTISVNISAGDSR
jgi:Na+-translocating ferredoxin:NAD+ oxidoreductase RnfG subunit